MIFVMVSKLESRGGWGNGIALLKTSERFRLDRFSCKENVYQPVLLRLSLLNIIIICFPLTEQL